MVIVAGGGLSGLSAAYYLTQKYSNSNLKLILFEATKRCGGWINSLGSQDYVFEAGPRTIRPVGDRGINTLNLIEDVGLSDKVVPIRYDHPAATNRMIYAKNKLNALPRNPMDIFKTIPPFSKPLLWAVLRDLWKPKASLREDTIYNFIERRFGKDVADYAVSPLICGICAGDAKEITVNFLLKTPFEHEQKHGGVIRGVLKTLFKEKVKDVDVDRKSSLSQKARNERWSIYSLKGGLEQLPFGLSEQLSNSGVKTYFDHKIQEIKFYDNNQKIRIKIKEDYEFITDHLFSCIPSFELAPLLEKNHPALASELLEIPFVDVIVVNLHYTCDTLLKHNAFGFLVPPIEKLPILGVIFDSCCFAEQKGTVLTVMMGGKWFNEYFSNNCSEEYILDIATSQINKILNINDKPSSHKVNILRKCIPQYTIGHYDRILKIRNYIKENQLPISLCGASYDGVGVNDVIMSSKVAVDHSVLT